MEIPTYQLLIDWDSDGGLLVADFESGIDGWLSATFGTVLPTLEHSTVRAYHGTGSLLVTWKGNSEIVVGPPTGNWIVGREYTVSVRAWVPSVGGHQVVISASGMGFGNATSGTNSWVESSLTFTANSTTHQIFIWSNGPTTNGEQTWLDYVRIVGEGEDVTTLVPWESPIEITVGRDKARALAPITPGRSGFQLDNESLDYSPENASSPLAGQLGPGREVVLAAFHGGTAYTLLRGHLDDFKLDPDPGSWLVSFTVLDGLARFKDAPVSTALYPAVRVGQAVHHVLDAVGWTGGRDIDPGGSTIRWWWEDTDDGFAALMRLWATEGPRSLMSISPGGDFVFRDRHHRLVRAASTTVQATFRDSGAEPLVENDLDYDVGWKEIVNSVEATITQREPAAVAEPVWEDSNYREVLPGQTVTLTVRLDNPVWAAQVPTVGSDPDLDPDVLYVGAIVPSASLSRTSGQSLELHLSVAPGAGSAARILRVRLRGQPVTGVRSLKLVRQDTESIRRTGGVKPLRLDTPWLNQHDAEAIMDLVLGQRAEPLPTVTFELLNSNATTLAQQLQRDLSDRVRTVFGRIGMDAECHIEQIKYSISEGAIVLTTRFGCEKIRALPANVFRFDVTGAGFDDGVFAPSGIDDPASIFRFDTAGQGFDDGVFAT